MKHFLFIIIFVFSIAPSVFADECLSYKLNPNIEILVPEWRKEIVQPIKHMDLWHGNVVATLSENYDITGDTTYIEDGICVSLRDVSAMVGYSDFLVQVDSRHMPNSCTYNAVLSHEDEHIRAYLSVIDDYKNDIRSAVSTASNSIMPVFVRDISEIDGALDILHDKLQQHPEVILIKQKIQAEQEIRNKRVDQHDHGNTLKQCMK